MTTMTLVLMMSCFPARGLVTVSSSLNPRLSGTFVRGVLPGHERAFVAEARSFDERSEEARNGVVWLFAVDRGIEGWRWHLGESVFAANGGGNALAFLDTWTNDPCLLHFSSSSSSSSSSSWMVAQAGKWEADNSLSVRCEAGGEPTDRGGIHACPGSSNGGGDGGSGSSGVPCVRLAAPGAVDMPLVMLGTAYIGAFHGAGAADPRAVEEPPAIEAALTTIVAAATKTKNTKEKAKATTTAKAETTIEAETISAAAIAYPGLDLGSQRHPAYANELRGVPGCAIWEVWSCDAPRVI